MELKGLKLARSWELGQLVTQPTSQSLSGHELPIFLKPQKNKGDSRTCASNMSESPHLTPIKFFKYLSHLSSSSSKKEAINQDKDSEIAAYHPEHRYREVSGILSVKSSCICCINSWPHH